MFLYHGWVWIVFDCIKTDFKDETWWKRLKFFFCMATELCFLCILLSLCLFKHAQEYLKYRPSQMTCLLFSLQQLLVLFGTLQSAKMTVFCSKMVTATRVKTFILGLYGVVSDEEEEAAHLFSVHFAPSPTFSTECQVSLGLKGYF